MKTLRILGLAGTCLVATVASAQNYAIDWFTIDGGGGTSTGGVYSVSGTIGQPDAGLHSGGSYTLVGGFWGVIQTRGAPLLTISRDLGTDGLTVSWNASASGFVLERTATLAASPASPWSQVELPYQTNAGRIFVTEPSPSGNTFYRLRKP